MSAAEPTHDALKAEDEALRLRNAELEQRNAELERAVSERERIIGKFNIITDPASIARRSLDMIDHFSASEQAVLDP